MKNTQAGMKNAQAGMKNTLGKGMKYQYFTAPPHSIWNLFGPNMECIHSMDYIWIPHGMGSIPHGLGGDSISIPYGIHSHSTHFIPIPYGHILIPPIPHESIDSMKEGGFH